MLFMTFLDILPGQYTKAIRVFKNPKVPGDVEIKQSLWLFGKPDAVFLFEAEDEGIAGEFAVQFGEVAAVKTSLVFPIENMRWTNIHWKRGLCTIRIIETDLEHPFFVTAADEAIAIARSQGRVEDTLHFYRRDPPAISLGYFKKVEEDVYVDRCEEKNVVIVRRTSGGGTIYTDKGQLIYALITGKRIGTDVEDSFKKVCSVIVKALAALGVDSVYKSPNDITINGRKISGSAQTIKDGATLIHGTVIADLDTDIMNYVLKEKKPGYVSSIKTETGLDIDIAEIKTSMISSFSRELGQEFKKAKLSEYENILIKQLITNKYGSKNWNLKR